jgi:hypothetical protein
LSGLTYVILSMLVSSHQALIFTFPRIYQRIQENLRASLAHIRQSRISPRAIVAPQPGAVPPTLGVGLVADEGSAEGGLQEARVARDAWRNVRDALQRLKTGEAGENPAKEELKDVNMKDEESK